LTERLNQQGSGNFGIETGGLAGHPFLKGGGRLRWYLEARALAAGKDKCIAW